MTGRRHGERRTMTPRQLLTAYDTAYQAHHGVRAPIVGSKDGPLAARLLSLYSYEDLECWLGTFFTMRDPFIQKTGHTFGVFSACIGKVIAASPKPKSAQPEIQTYGRAAEIRAAMMKRDYGE